MNISYGVNLTAGVRDDLQNLLTFLKSGACGQRDVWIHALERALTPDPPRSWLGSLRIEIKHKHHWRSKPMTIKVIDAGITKCHVLVEDCHCGVVRTITIADGEPPIIRLSQTVPHSSQTVEGAT